jgi:adenine deaminase
MNSFSVSGQVIDLFERRTFPAEVTVENGKIKSITEVASAPSRYILPGFVDAHVHIESSMLVPTEFARLAVAHGTVATVSDPHEIANVCGVDGVQYMIENSRNTPFKIFFGAPSCVPATFFETAGAVLDSSAVEKLLASDDIWYLSEMMNYPGVLHDDPEVLAKIKAAVDYGKPVDGHAPAVRGDAIRKYASAGITTDHESFTYEEAAEKITCGIKCLIREGSAAKNFEALIKIIAEHPEMVMFCSDDKHPDELILHHINNHVRRALEKGYDVYNVLRAASVNPVLHYNLPVGLLRINDPADFIVIDDLEKFTILNTYINGELVAEKGSSLLPYQKCMAINSFSVEPISTESFKVSINGGKKSLRVIEAVDGQLITNEVQVSAKVENRFVVSDPGNDILKIVVVNRYEKASTPSIAFIKNFGLKTGAIASTVAHDCHNIIAVGVDDDSIAGAINILISSKGGIAVASNKDDVDYMPLPIAGLMSDKDGYTVAADYSRLDKKAKDLGSTLRAPFMSLSFMALLVIPSLKLSDKGLFNGSEFRFTDLIVDTST